MKKETAGLVAQNLFDLHAFRRTVRHIVFGPTWILITIVPTILMLVGSLKDEFDLPKSTILMIYMARTVGWACILILALPRWARFCMSRNLPFLFAYLSLLTCTLLFANLLTFVFTTDLDLAGLLARLLRHLTLGATLSVILVLFIETEIRGLGSDPALVPVLWQVRLTQSDPPRSDTPASADLSLLDPALSGRIIAIQAQNQYVEVATPMKTHLLRMPFQMAIGKMPSAAGHRVHRSWWLANDVPVTLTRVGQNYEAGDAQGRSYPVSKPNLDLVRALIDRNLAQAGDAVPKAP